MNWAFSFRDAHSYYTRGYKYMALEKLENIAVSDQQGMHLAIQKATAGVLKGQTPFGTAIVYRGKVVACAHNQVWQRHDITAHAEIQALRLAGKQLKQLHLEGATLYSTCEPCPMCLSACHWARITRIFYGATIEDAAGFGFNELKISNKQMANMGKLKLDLHAGFLKKECLAVFQQWKDLRKASAY
jgi:tRNA(Arg) A34 adenosine deaminase TadA